MSRMTALMLALVLSSAIPGCNTGEGPDRLAQRRVWLRAIADDPKRQMAQRVQAFDELIDTLAAGTSEDVVLQSLRINTASRIAEGPSEAFSFHTTAPDGTDRWITLVNGRVQY